MKASVSLMGALNDANGCMIISAEVSSVLWTLTQRQQAVLQSGIWGLSVGAGILYGGVMHRSVR